MRVTTSAEEERERARLWGEEDEEEEMEEEEEEEVEVGDDKGEEDHVEVKEAVPGANVIVEDYDQMQVDQQKQESVKQEPQRTMGTMGATPLDHHRHKHGSIRLKEQASRAVSGIPDQPSLRLLIKGTVNPASQRVFTDDVPASSQSGDRAGGQEGGDAVKGQGKSVVNHTTDVPVVKT